MPFCCSPRLFDWISSRSLYSQAKEQLGKKQFQKALDCLSQIKQLRIQSVVGKSWRLFLVCSQQLNISREQILRELIEYQQIDDTNPKLMLQIGTLLFQLQRDSQAEAWLRKSVQLSPKDCQNYRQITEVLKKHKKIFILVQFSTIWYKSLGDLSQQLVKLGKLYDSIKDRKRAADIFLKLLLRHPEQKQYYLLYLSNERLKYIPDLSQAFKIIQKGRALFGQDSNFLQIQSLFYYANGNTYIFTDNIKYYINQNISISKQTYFLLIRVLIDQYQIKQANQYALMLSQKYKQQLFALWLVARTQFLLANFQSYRKMCQNILKRYELQGYSRSDNIYAVFQVYRTKNEFQKAIQMIQLYHQITGQTFQADSSAILDAVLCYLQGENTEKQQQYLRILSRQSKFTVFAELKLSLVYFRKGNKEECLKILQQYSQRSIQMSLNEKIYILQVLLQIGFNKEGLQFYQTNLITIFDQCQCFRTHMDCLKISIQCLIKNDHIDQAFRLFVKYEQICRAHLHTHIILLQAQIFVKILQFCLFFGRLGVFERDNSVINNIFNQINGLYMKNSLSKYYKIMENFEIQQNLLKIENVIIDEMTPN